ncbi:pathogenicity island protein [Staphylococcus epidermidis]|uniref:pathogenicity island protein n=1 Tax=Staphylococcus epidermidis TaxID=1282 RepID=UPI00026C0B79|nr:pathogenicity island protein [Staphylococcus epidermidis]EJD77788.1 pathogenicity island protein [Staphylococcus epidermidis NIHLM095]EJD77914.1 pathogenicity island protein [Staphylococcus epidermidis NIHLM087]MBE7349182.1 pathogenicity island protein [Staphylococcus epidermidis]MBE7360673.1 pathogenicity island protein [Staphylococcus epidermidis]MBE9453317.1 pathogenicity island protein [Staphylococcus epidermidis]
MNIEIIVNHFETRTATLLRYFTNLHESSYKEPFPFKIYNDPFNIVYLISKGKMYAHVLINDCEVRKTFKIASGKHTERLLESIEGHYAGYDLHDGTHANISDMMAELMFDNEYFMYGLETFAESNNSDMFEYMSKGFNIDELKGVQSSNADVIGNMEILYQLATGINEPAPELVEGLKIITEFIQNEKANRKDYLALELKLKGLKNSYYNGVKA